jgi:hypothetical protein
MAVYRLTWRTIDNKEVQMTTTNEMTEKEVSRAIRKTTSRWRRWISAWMPEAKGVCHIRKKYVVALIVEEIHD